MVVSTIDSLQMWKRKASQKTSQNNFSGILIGHESDGSFDDGFTANVEEEGFSENFSENSSGGGLGLDSTLASQVQMNPLTATDVWKTMACLVASD